MPLSRSLAAGAVATFALTAFAPVGDVGGPTVPEQVPDRGPVASEPMQRGGLLVTPGQATEQATPVIDGDPSDWGGRPSRIGGTSRFDAGEFIYSDFVHDAWGADDGTDAERLAVLDPLAAAESRTTRADATFQALGAQFGAPDPVGADEAYGDALANDVADIATLRWATSDGGQTLDLLVEVTNLADDVADQLAVLVLVDAQPELSAGFSSEGLASTVYDRSVLLTSDGSVATGLDAEGQGWLDSGMADVAIRSQGWTNALEARLPAELVAPGGSFRGTVVTGRLGDDGFVPANVAYRPGEPVAGMYNDQLQALALLDGNVDQFATTFDVADLVAGRTDEVVPGPGYHERTFRSDEGISAEFREGLDDVYEDTVWQRYALLVPSEHDPAEATQATFWLHYRGGKAHSGGAWSPRLFTQLGEEVGGIVVTPHGRGERRWYEGSSHQDFWEVFADLEDTFRIDPSRRYLSGYSMGGHGGPMMGLLYPDQFAGVYVQAAAIGSDLFDVAVNGEHVPFWIDVSAQDGLIATNQSFSEELDGLGYRHVIQRFVAGEHYTQAILDEWAAGARYLQLQETPANPRTVTYRVVPALLETINHGRGEPTSVTFAPDGAWWVDDIVVADGAEQGTVRATAGTLPGEERTTRLSLGDVRPGDHSVPSVRTGLEWVTTSAEIVPEVTVDLTGVASVTLDAGRWQLAAGTTTVRVTTDGTAEVTLSGLPQGTLVDGVAVDGAPTVVVDGEVTITLTR